MKTISIEQTDLDACVEDAQQERVVLTRNGVPVVVLVGIAGLDADQLGLASSDRFWRLIAERRQQSSISRAELERRIEAGASGG